MPSGRGGELLILVPQTVQKLLLAES